MVEAQKIFVGREIWWVAHHHCCAPLRPHPLPRPNFLRPPLSLKEIELNTPSIERHREIQGDHTFGLGFGVGGEFRVLAGKSLASTRAGSITKAVVISHILPLCTCKTGSQ